MRVLRDFAWFTVHSWRYMKGDSAAFLRGFFDAWKTFRAAMARDRAW